jgi:hypothetical protein
MTLPIRPIVEFTARGSARAVSQAIERYAAERRVVNALVVPWESDATTLRMAVTWAKADGWAIEHANLGTIALADLGDGTRVAVYGVEGDHGAHSDPAHAKRDELAAKLTVFAQQIANWFATADPTAEPPR